MNKHERAALVRDQYDAGLANGRDIASIITKKFPDGFTAISEDIRTIADNALAHVVNALTTNGVERRYIQPFKRGYRTGLRKTFKNYAAECAALGTSIG
jgi:hypothetical protein